MGEGELSSVLGVLATGRNQGRLEGFTINMTSLDDIFLEVTSGGETRRLGTGETGPALAEEGDQFYDPLKLSQKRERDESRGDEEEAIYRRPGSLSSSTSNASPLQNPPDPFLVGEQGGGDAEDPHELLVVVEQGGG